jgi:hypothetical protein
MRGDMMNSHLIEQIGRFATTTITRPLHRLQSRIKHFLIFSFIPYASELLKGNSSLHEEGS